jgi:hypothetical protein
MQPKMKSALARKSCGKPRAIWLAWLSRASASGGRFDVEAPEVVGELLGGPLRDDQDLRIHQDLRRLCSRQGGASRPGISAVTPLASSRLRVPGLAPRPTTMACICIRPDLDRRAWSALRLKARSVPP